MTTTGEGLASAGLATAATGAGVMIGIPMAVVGVGMSLGSTVVVTGGAVGGGATAAWRLYRFGLMALIAVGPLPFDTLELENLKQKARR